MPLLPLYKYVTLCSCPLAGAKYVFHIKGQCHEIFYTRFYIQYLSTPSGPIRGTLGASTGEA
jgi:hypothetical protein